MPALTSLLDGRYAEVRRLVRANLAQHAAILEEARDLPPAEFHERVLEETSR